MVAPKRAWPVSLAWVAGLCLGLACAETTRHRMLTFFFDGVPEPGASARQADRQTALEEQAAATAAARAAESATAREAILARVATVPAHPPYREFRCGACHAADSGQLLRTPQEGLCRSCHKDKPGEVRYVHGPVAVDDCLFCHHHHGGQFPKMLRAEPTDTCLRCHNRDDLTEEAHPAETQPHSCTVCHLPHGGNNRFFLKQDDR